MAGSVSSSCVEKLRGKLSSPAVQELFLAWGLESDLERLDISLLCINMNVVSAEEQSDSNQAISFWLRQLRDVLYGAEDVLDDFAYQALRTQIVDTHGGLISKVHRYFSIYNPIAFRFRIGRKIKEIRERLDEILAYKSHFNLDVRFGNPSLQLRKRDMIHCSGNALDIVGRERDKETIVAFLIDSSQGHYGNVSVLAIVGICGLGKTVVAQLVCNDQRVAGHFDKRMWVCLSDMKEFNVKQILKKIVTFVSEKSGFDHSTLEQLQICIQNSLRGKRFLLVLDDMWNVDRSGWAEFKALLACGDPRSKILVTTRITSVASCVGTVDTHNLEGISHEDCVCLFKKLAFTCEDDVDKNLMEIGEEIVRKCKGVPLAVRVVGSMLFSKQSIQEWLLVRDISIWQLIGSDYGILPTFKFSFDELPSHLKQCLVYCSVFPEDYLFLDFWLISFWMAHGLLQSRTNQDPTHVGRQYINELLSRGFFQNFKEHSWCCSFKMHGLMRDIAISLGQEEFSSSKNFSNNVRHVYFEVQNFSANSSDYVIRTVLADKGFGATFSTTCIFKFKLLRVLSLANSEIEELPHSIGTLKLLRSLDLRDCRRLKRLPSSICKLHCLETLLLAGCAELEELPTSMAELVNLRWLWITTKQKHLLKNGIECISSLNFLALSGCRNLDFSFEGNKVILNQKSLQTLRISDCESLVFLFPLNFRALEVLYIRNCEKFYFHSQADDVSSQWFVQLPSLRSLTIQGLPSLLGLPQWIQRCARTLQYLKIKDCPELTALPRWLPNLTSLLTLKILSCPKLPSLPEGIQNLTAMIEVKITECGVLSERCKEESGQDWPKIAHVPNIVIA